MKISLFIFERLQIGFFGEINDHELAFLVYLDLNHKLCQHEKTWKNW